MRRLLLLAMLLHTGGAALSEGGPSDDIVVTDKRVAEREVPSLHTAGEEATFPSIGEVVAVSGTVEVDSSQEGDDEIHPVQLKVGSYVSAGILYIKNGASLILKFSDESTVTYDSATYSRLINVTIKGNAT